MILRAHLLILLKVSHMHFDLASIMTIMPNINGFKWDDARFPTIQEMVRRGLHIEDLIKLILQQVTFLYAKGWLNT